jgi:hypothetical protein
MTKKDCEAWVKGCIQDKNLHLMMCAAVNNGQLACAMQLHACGAAATTVYTCCIFTAVQ